MPRTGSRENEKWHEWYAEYLIGHGLDRILEDMLTVDRLARFLSTMDEVRRSSSALMEWSDGTAGGWWIHSFNWKLNEC